jgi:pectinesterase
MSYRAWYIALVLTGILFGGGCGKSSSPQGGTGGKPTTSQSGGNITSGGSSATNESGGSTAATNSGGASATGGVAGSQSMGGSVSKGGAPSMGGFSGGAIVGGASAQGGTINAGGITTSGGVSSTGGVVGGSTTVTVPEGPCEILKLTWTGPDSRPQLADASANCFSIKKYLAAAGPLGSLVTDNWDPTAGLPAPGTLTPAFTVATDGSGSHKTVQEAIDAANVAAGTNRVAILVKPGTYREPVCVKAGSVPITLYGADPDPTKVIIVYDNYNKKPKTDTVKENPCKPADSGLPKGSQFGTDSSATVYVRGNEFQAMNMTFANDTDEEPILADRTAAKTTAQAIALATTGDRLVFQNLRITGNQDTLRFSSNPKGTSMARSYYKSSYVEGDIDFVYGEGVAVLDNCTIMYTLSRGKGDGSHFAPSTPSAHPYGLLIINSKILGVPELQAGKVGLGRAYDNEVGSAGQMVIRETELGVHVDTSVPYGVSTSSKVYDVKVNRFFEYKNTGPGAAK